jgi:hypothetical protein
MVVHSGPGLSIIRTAISLIANNLQLQTCRPLCANRLANAFLSLDRVLNDLREGRKTRSPERVVEFLEVINVGPGGLA